MFTVKIKKRQLKRLIDSYIRKVYRNFSSFHRTSFDEVPLPDIIEVAYEQSIKKSRTYSYQHRFEPAEIILLLEEEVREALALWLKKKIGGNWRVVSISRVVKGRLAPNAAPFNFAIVISPAKNRSRTWYVEPIGESNDAIAAHLHKTTGEYEAQFKYRGQLVCAYDLPDKETLLNLVAGLERFDYMYCVYSRGKDGQYRQESIAELRLLLRRIKAVKGVQLSLDDIPAL
jgi:hypothetical protein